MLQEKKKIPITTAVITKRYLGINPTKDVQALPEDKFKTLLNGRKEKLS